MMMKVFLLVTFFSSLLIGQSYAFNAKAFRDQEYAYKMTFLKKEYDQRKIDIDNLIEAKSHLIDGNIKIAQHYLSRIHETESKIGPIKKRYQAIIYFIEGKYEKVIKELKGQDFLANDSYREVCMMQLYAYLAMNNVNKVLETNRRCQPITTEFSRNGQIWLLNLIDLITKKQFLMGNGRSLSNPYLTQGSEMARIWLKMALYSNREHTIDFYIGSLPSDSYSSKRVREILSYAYYRTGDYEKALSFAENIVTANSENIKGNIKLENKEYELAFGHFKLALSKKANSRNAIERAIPLAWKLGQFQDGKDLLIRHLNSDYFAKKALDIAFDIRLENYILASRKIELLNRKFKETRPIKLTLMNSFISTMLDDKSLKQTYAVEACSKFDGLNCWLSLQHTMWPSIAGTIRRDENVIDTNEFSLSTLKEKATVIELKETISVNQTDIEELDSKEVKIPMAD